MVFLNTLPLWLSGALLVGLATVLAMAGPSLFAGASPGPAQG